MGKQTEELVGEVDWVVFQSPDPPPNQFVIVKLVDGTSCKGKAAAEQFEPGLAYRFLGRWEQANQYGPQFAFSSLTIAAPNGERGTIHYLRRAPGIGAARARAIWEHYGADAVGMLRESPADVAAIAKGLTLEAAQGAARFFTEIAADEQTTIELTDLLAGRKFPRGLIDLAKHEWGAAAGEKIRANPYVLLRFRGVGFPTADSLYLELGLPADALQRQGYCAWYRLHSDTEGHTWHATATCCDAVRKSVAGTDADPAAAIGWALDAGLIQRREPDLLAAAPLAMAEARLAMSVHAASREEITPPVVESGQLNDHQLDQIGKALGSPVSILAGRPGTGKTFSVAQLIDQTHGSVAVCAPTGKAAVRATEALAAAGIDLVATTIHRLLGVASAEGGAWEFAHHADNPLPLDLIVVDEASMIDTLLMTSLFEARRRGCRIMLVGDPDQLSPVGSGAPLRDLMRAQEYGHLTEIVRNTGRIPKACKRLAEDHAYEPSPAGYDLDAGENLVHIEQATPEHQIEQLKLCLDQLTARGLADPVWDTQIVVAVNEKSPLGRKNLNRLLQQHLNPHADRVEGNPFRDNDKVVCLKNGFYSLDQDWWAAQPSDARDRVILDMARKASVANGEQGRVLETRPKSCLVELTSPSRQVVVPLGQDGAAHWDLAYAVSVHKSQGSEWPIVITMLDNYPGAMFVCDRHWLYTAISRPKTLGLTIGRLATAREMAARSYMWRRRTCLVEQIQELWNQAEQKEWEEILE